jgi:hypothetical protein
VQDPSALVSAVDFAQKRGEQECFAPAAKPTSATTLRFAADAAFPIRPVRRSDSRFAVAYLTLRKALRKRRPSRLWIAGFAGACRIDFRLLAVRNLTVMEALQTAFSAEPKPIDDATLISRIIHAYGQAAAVFEGHGESQWASINERSSDLHRALLKGDAAGVAMQLRNPAGNDLLCGFDEATQTIYSAHKASDAGARAAWGSSAHKRLIRLAEAVGAIPVWLQSVNRTDDRDLSIEALLSKLDAALGFEVDFPNPYPDEFGLRSSRGLINHRAIFAIYQAWRLSAWVSGHTRVLEIGAGSGRTAYYAWKLGLRDYTIVDLPLTNVAQANFLGRVLDPAYIALSGEASHADQIRIFGPAWFHNSSERFDVALNADSITEIDCRNAAAYFAKIATHADVLVSINHEANSFRAADLPTFVGTLTKPMRFPYWLDDGYVEEIFMFRDRAPAPGVDNELKRLGSVILDLRHRIERMDSVRAVARRLMELTARRLIGR